MILLALLCAGCGDHISVPVEACTRSATGKTKIEQRVNMVGKTTILIPHLRLEYRYDCTFTRME